MDWRERNFKKVDSGHAFFPYGAFSRGYLVDDAKKEELIAFIKRLDGSSVLIVIAVAAAAGWWIAGTVDGAWLGVGLIALPLAIYRHVKLQRALAGLPRTDARRTFSEQLRATSNTMPSLAIYVALVATFLITAGDVFFIYESLRDRDVHGLLLFAAALPIFALSLLLSVWLLYLKHSRRNLSDHSVS
jgi:hypothetical protein